MKGEENMPTNEEVLMEMHITKNHQPATQRKIQLAINKYCKFNEMTLEELLDEAEQEEEAGIRWKNRTIKKRLISYRNSLVQSEKEYTKVTIKTYMRQILTVYKFFDIELHELPRINYADDKPVRFKDLPDKDVIREVLKIADTRMTAIILFLTSTGVDRNQITKITIEQYIEATKEYHNGGSLKEIIETLEKTDNVIGTFELKRSKTGKYFTTFCSPECIRAINKYLRTRKLLTRRQKLFDIDYTYIGIKLNHYNDKLKLGKVRKYNRIRCHMFRKFHASALYNDGMNRDQVNDLQGKVKNTTDQSYFFVNDDDLKVEYMKHLSALQIYDEVNEINVKSKEFIELESENRSLKSDINQLKADVDGILRMFEEL